MRESVNFKRDSWKDFKSLSWGFAPFFKVSRSDLKVFSGLFF